MFRNLLIADSGKGHVEEMVRMLQDLPSMKRARPLCSTVPEQSKAQAEDHRVDAEALLDKANERMGLQPDSASDPGSRRRPPNRLCSRLPRRSTAT